MGEVRDAHPEGWGGHLHPALLCLIPLLLPAPLCCVSIQSLLPSVLKTGKSFPVKISPTIFLLGIQSGCSGHPGSCLIPPPRSLLEHCDTETSRPPLQLWGSLSGPGSGGPLGPPVLGQPLPLRSAPQIHPQSSRFSLAAAGPLRSPPRAGWVIRGPCASVWKILPPLAARPQVAALHLALVPSRGGFWGHP